MKLFYCAQKLKTLISKILLLLVLVAISATSPAHAATKNSKRSNDFTGSAKYAALVVNSETGEVIYHRNAKNQLHPASLTKLMTIYIAFQGLADGSLSMNTKLKVSARAAAMPKTNLRLKAGQIITAKEAILALIVHSANDAAVVLAEAISGSEDAFAYQMTSTARSLGMHDTNFENASGWHDSEQVTTAYDMAKLAIALRRDYPQYYKLFSTKSFKFNGRVINTHNRVMQRYPWADGLKTGYVNASGFNLITSTNRNDGRLVGVVMGGSSAYARDTHMINLLEYGYTKISNNKQQAIAKLSKPSIDQKPDVFMIAQQSQAAHPIPHHDAFAALSSSKSEIQLDSSNAETQSKIIESQNTRLYEHKPTLDAKNHIAKSYNKAKKIIRKAKPQSKKQGKKSSHKTVVTR